MARLGKPALSAIVVLMAACAGLVPVAALAGNGAAADTSSAPAKVKPIWEMSRTATLDGSAGGALKGSKWTLIIPPGAFHGTATVTMTERDIRKRTVELSITPESSNQFSVPVRLVYKKMTPQENVAQESIYWWNPGSMAWEPAPNQAGDVVNGTLSSGLGHFSTYSVFDGRAGW